MSDEQRFNTYSRIISPSEAVIPSYLFYTIFHLTSYCGSGFLECGRLLNVSFLGLSSIPFYLIGRKYLPRKICVFITLATLLAPFGYYATYFMPEILYYLLFMTSAWVIVNESDYNNRWLHSGVSGVLLGLISLVKPHAFFLIPAYVAFRIYSELVGRRTCDWPRLVALTVSAVVAMILIRFALGCWIAGPAGANLIGSMYSDVVNKTAAPDHWQMLLAIIHVAKGHVFGLLVLFATPLVIGAIALSQPNSAEVAQAKSVVFLAGAVLVTMLAITAVYTAQVDGMNKFESLDRLHMRYYFFLFPIFVSFGAVFASCADFRLTKWQLALTILALAATLYAGFIGMAGYTPYPVDAPELWAATTTPYVRYCFTLLQALALILLTVRTSLASKFFIYVVTPALIIHAAFAFPALFLKQYESPNAADRAGVFFNMTVGSREPVVVSGDDDSEVTRTIFHLNNSDIQKLLIPKKQIILKTQITPKARWIVSLNDNPLDSALQGNLSFDMPGYKIWHVGTSAYDIDFAASSWSGVESIIGISHEETFGRWSDAKQVVIRFYQDIPPNITLNLTASAFSKNVGQSFQITIGDQAHQLVLGATPKITEIKFRNIPAHSREVVISVPQPISPMEIGLNADTRKLGVALSHLTLTPTTLN